MPTFVFLRVALFSLGLLSQVAQAQNAPTSFRILDIKPQGTGCKSGTVGLNISSDQQAFTLTFSEFIAELSATTDKKDQRQSCRLTFDTENQPGWEFAVVGVIFRGASYLQDGVTGQLQARYGTRGKDAQSSMNLSGPLDESYVHADQVAVSQLKWSGCKNGNGQPDRNKDFTIDSNIQLRSRDSGKQGYLTVDSVDGEVSQTYDLVWRRCDGKGSRFASVCRFEDSGRPGASRSLIGKGRGNSAQEAQALAQADLASRCGGLGKGLPRCDASAARCETFSL